MIEIEGYSLLEKIHTGTHMVTYRARRQIDQLPVILKLPIGKHPSRKEIALLRHEYQLLKQLSINGVVKVHDLIRCDLVPVLVLEDIGGQSLKDFLGGKPLDLSTFFKFSLQLTDILGQLHRHHIIHKDIKPANIIVEPNNFLINLVDLSISSQLSEEIQEYVSPNILEGSLPYISPEQTGRMNCPIDYRADFYSLGITFFEMLTGKLPFSAKDPSEWVHCHIAKVPPTAREINLEVPEVLAAIISKLISKTPADRYASAAGLKADLLQCRDQWEGQGKIQSFQLGKNDIHDQLHISHKLYGRKDEVQLLLSAFERVSQGETELLLVSGYSGIGKTSLIKEIHKPIVKKYGYFFSGKFDQLQRSTPYSAIVDAFQGLIRQVLTEGEEVLSRIRQKLLAALGQNGQVIVEVLPEVENIIGLQPVIPDLPPSEAQNRFNFAFQKFIKVLAVPEHPLVIFLDDLQWADKASLTLLETLFTNPDIRNVLLVGAYRNNEVDASHPLSRTLENLKQSKAKIQTLELNPLSLQNTQELLADTFNYPSPKVMDLAVCLQEKTEGNPFFINEFLRVMHQKHHLKFSYELTRWQWDIRSIQQQAATANVIDLLASKIRVLSPSSQEILKLAACIGHQFNLKKLVQISELDVVHIAKALWEMINQNLLIPIEESYLTSSLISGTVFSEVYDNLSYRFIHDRVQQAAYNLISDEMKQKTHLHIGRIMLHEKELDENDDRLFEIMDQLNHSICLITDPAEKKQIAQCNFWAGKKAKTSTAYQAAINYLKTAIELMQPLDWEKDYTLNFLIYQEYARCHYLIGKFDEAQAYFDDLMKRSRNLLDRIAIYRLNIEMLSIVNKHREAIDLGLRALNLLGIKISKKPSILKIMLLVLKIKMQVGEQVQEIKLPLLSSPFHRAAADLMNQLFNNAFIVDQKLFVHLVGKNMGLSLKHGYTDSTSMSCLVYAFVLIHQLHWKRNGLQFVQWYYQLVKAYGSGVFEGKNHFILGAFINTWTLPFVKALDNLLLASQLTRDVGHISYSNYSNIIIIFTVAAMGQPITEVKKHLRAALDFCDRVKMNEFSGLLRFLKYIFRCLEGRYQLDVKQIFELEREILQAGNKTELNFFYSNCIKLFYIMGDYSNVLQFALKHEEYNEYGLGLINQAEASIFKALTLTAIYKKKNLIKKIIFLNEIKKIHTRLQRWAEWCPDNFKYYLLLLDAELARIHNKSSLAMNLYDQAIKEAQKQDALHIVGIANECAARFYFEKNLVKFLNLYLAEAYYAYQRWGSSAKCELLEAQYSPDFIPTGENLAESPLNFSQTTTTTSSSSIEMIAILKSTQVISGEIQLDKLLKKLLQIVLENAGAQRSVLIAEQENSWVIEAEGTVIDQQVHLIQPIALQAYTNLPLTLIQFVRRVQRPIIIQDASQAEEVLHDPYVIREQPKSLLAMPIFYKGRSHRILYLEHLESTGAFTTQHLKGLQLLTSQAAISLDNAYLYYQVTHDPLTGLANRNLLHQTFHYMSLQMNRDNKRRIAILFLDLDHFKRINDTMGHEVGDQLLMHMASKIKDNLRENDLVARMGGDEFVVMLTDIKKSDQLNRLIDKLFQCLTQATIIQNHRIHPSVSMGISIFPDDGADIQTLLKKADIAMYQAKANGRNRSQYYSEALNRAIQKTYSNELELQNAIDKKELCLYYQPIYDIHSQTLVGMEVLVRWLHPVRGIISAKDIIPLAEKTELIIPLGEWVLRTACEQMKSWLDQGFSLVPFAVNLSALQTHHASISELIIKILNETGLDPRYLELELTESSFIENFEKTLHELKVLREFGISLVIDDFGTGYSSLNYIKRLPLSKIKIDRSFIQDILTDSDDRAITRAIIVMAHQLQIKVIAEGIETPEQLEFLRKSGVDAVQGYFLKRPLDTTSCQLVLAESFKYRR